MLVNQLREYEIQTDFKTVWINHEGKCVARFGPRGAEVKHKNCDGFAHLSYGEGFKGQRFDYVDWACMVERTYGVELHRLVVVVPDTLIRNDPLMGIIRLSQKETVGGDAS